MAISEIGSKYDVYCPIKESEVMALKAVDDQMLMRPSDMERTVTVTIARTGIK